MACARNRPVDTVFQQKVFFEVVKQFQGEYMGSVLAAMFESMGSTVAHDAGDFVLGDAIDAGLADSVNENDAKFPPEFRLSKSNRREEGLSAAPTRWVHRHRSVVGIAGAYCTKLLADGGATVDQSRSARG